MKRNRDKNNDFFMTISAIAKLEGVSMQRIQQIINRAIDKLRKGFVGEYY